MHILMLGLSFVSTPVEIRERAALSSKQLPQVLTELVMRPHLPEALILSTCNRTEIYAVSEHPEAARAILQDFTAQLTGLPVEELAAYTEWYEDQEVTDHLFRVAAGLESLVLGEGQILSQIKDAYGVALECGSAGVILDRVFRAALTAGKRVRTETDIARGAVSVSSAAVELARETLGQLHGKTILLLGAGKMSELAVKQLADEGVSRVVVANRTVESAHQVAKAVGGEVVPWIEVARAIGEADVVLCATGAPHHVITAADVASTLAARRDPVVFIDISVPRNIDPALRELPMAQLFDIDDLHAVAHRHRAERASIVDDVLAILGEELAEFQTWFGNFRLTPMITSLRGRIEAVRDVELQRFWAKNTESFSSDQRALVEEMAQALVNKILHQPTHELKHMNPLEQQRHAAALKALFGLKVETLDVHYRRKIDERRARGCLAR